ncbi:MAG TPA: DNA polymerase ligase N-terminal domain-containing protein [Thermoanaerobaculia bacterium]|nr:DNA polymerase ligase N-terminal domain-containing protein [Thermoanaerobaculia bacterium]
MPNLLKKYRQMRDFGETPEPSGGKPKKRKLPIFVIQKHRASHLHYDFRLEMEGVLKSWAVPKGPSYDPATKRLAMMTEDHPYDYAKFEGVIPEGNYGAGNVIIWDEGQWEFVEPGDDPVAALKSGKLTFRMYGKKMFGEWALVKIGGRSKSDKGNEWLLLKHRDEFANADVDVTRVAPRSVVSNKLVEEMGGGRIWESNRKAAPRKAPTLADKLESSSRRVVKSSSRQPRASSSKTRSASKRATPAKRAPSRAVSARTRSSRAGAKRSARTTARRPPR